jgi:hypothetical protein
MPSELDFDIIKGLSKWRSELETYIDFENVFGNISKITYDYKLQNFQYKLLHRILPTNTLLELSIRLIKGHGFVVFVSKLICLLLIIETRPK